MPNDPYYRAHWTRIDDRRLAAYGEMFRWSEAAEALYAPAGIAPGQTVADFGCGPGHTAVELARRVGPGGHVHALDINLQFLRQTRENAARAGLAERITTHESDGAALPLGDGTLDRVTAKNTLMYVDDAVATFRAFRRALRPGGRVHAIDGDWFMMVVEPVDHDLWRAFVKAAAHACRHADMGRRLRGAARAAGFAGIELAVLARPDTDGRLLQMVLNMATYARESGAMPDADIALVEDTVRAALAEGAYLAVSPQFVLTAERPADGG